MNDIDFVITWVDGNDPDWLKEKERFKESGDNREIRYRDWEILRYWFRCVETNADWVRKIHFVTYGHIPNWLNTNHPKLNIVKHEDFIPQEYLPTFNSHTIELNMHRIKDLSENFVYFNDDMFVLDKVNKEFFFKNNLPCDAFQMNTIFFGKDSIGWINGSNISIINEHFEMRKVVRKNIKKVFNYKNGIKKNIKNIIFYFIVKWFPGFDYWHITTAYKKETFKEIWKIESDVLDETCRCKFREKTNVSPFLMKYWQLVKGDFSPTTLKTGCCFQMTDEMAENASNAIINKKYKMICVNDTGGIKNWTECKNVILDAFSKTFPNKSSFEK